MGIFSALVDFTAGYSPLESFLFDRLCQRATAPLHDYAFAQVAAQIDGPMRVLDVGCGAGHFARRLADSFPEIDVVGLDLSPEQIERARRRSADSRVRFVEASALDMPFEAGTFDLVCSLGSLKHWPDRGAGLRECTRVLRPGGRLWLTEGDRGCRHEDVHAFISTWNVPAKLRPMMAAFYRVTVVGQSLDLEDARALLDEVPELDAALERGEGLPIWVIAGNKRAH